jgi:hypothetical protein
MSTGRRCSTRAVPNRRPRSSSTGWSPGTWRHERGRISLEPFGRLGREDRRALREEAERPAPLYR